MRKIVTALLMLIVLTFLTGIAYPLFTTGLAQVLFRDKANGSLIYAGSSKTPLGSFLIGQSFEGQKYFHPRPSAAGQGYDASSSSGSNLGPTNKKLIEAVKRQIDTVRAKESLSPGTLVPADMVTASASGLDPHISPQAAAIQVPRVAKARNLSEAQVLDLVRKNTTPRQFGILGEPRVNVLQLNLELDELSANTRR